MWKDQQEKYVSPREIACKHRTSSTNFHHTTQANKIIYSVYYIVSKYFIFQFKERSDTLPDLPHSRWVFERRSYPEVGIYNVRHIVRLIHAKFVLIPTTTTTTTTSGHATYKAMRTSDGPVMNNDDELQHIDFKLYSHWHSFQL